MILKIILKKKELSFKLQDSSGTTCGCVNKLNKDLTMVTGWDRKYLERNNYGQ